MTRVEVKALAARIAGRVNASPILGFGPRELQVKNLAWDDRDQVCRLQLDFPPISIMIEPDPVRPFTHGRVCDVQPYLSDGNVVEFPPEGGDVVYQLIGAAAAWRRVNPEPILVDAR